MSLGQIIWYIFATLVLGGLLWAVVLMIRGIMKGE